MKRLFSFLQSGSLYASTYAMSAATAQVPAMKQAKPALPRTTRTKIEETLLAAFIAIGIVLLFQLLASATVVADNGGVSAEPDNETFQPVVVMLKSWMKGSYGLMIVFSVLAVGLAMTVFKYSLMWLAVAVGVAIAAIVGPAVSEQIFTAVL